MPIAALAAGGPRSSFSTGGATRPPGPGNAISLADTPVWDALWAKYPHSFLEASGEAVGLPPGVMGNSEVGHLTLGSGRIIYQDLSRINRAISDGSFFRNAELVDVMDEAGAAATSVHLMGLLSDAGVHSTLGHLQALVTLARHHGIARLFVHAFTDGRDTSPTAGRGYIDDLETFLEAEGLGGVATVSGRYYAMDRDRRWDRVKLAYDAIVHGKGLTASCAGAAVDEAYARDETDEFILPTVVCDDPASRVRDGDAVIFFNFRPDRARELAAALTQRDFAEFDREVPAPRLRFRGNDRIRPEPGRGGRLSQGGDSARAGRGDQRRGSDPASHRGDREVRARYLLLQRRP